MQAVQSSPSGQASLTHFDARQGYRPSSIALGAVRPILSYPGIVDLANAFFKLIATDSDPFNPAGKIDPSKPLGPGNRRPIPGAASAQFQQLLAVLREELRTATTPAPVPPLTLTTGPQAPVWQSGMGSPSLSSSRGRAPSWRCRRRSSSTRILPLTTARSRRALAISPSATSEASPRSRAPSRRRSST